MESIHKKKWQPVLKVFRASRESREVKAFQDPRGFKDL
jgi:hypothetical protein